MTSVVSLFHAARGLCRRLFSRPVPRHLLPPSSSSINLRMGLSFPPVTFEEARRQEVADRSAWRERATLAWFAGTI